MDVGYAARYEIVKIEHADRLARVERSRLAQARVPRSFQGSTYRMPARRRLAIAVATILAVVGLLTGAVAARSPVADGERCVELAAGKYAC